MQCSAMQYSARHYNGALSFVWARVMVWSNREGVLPVHCVGPTLQYCVSGGERAAVQCTVSVSFVMLIPKQFFFLPFAPFSPSLSP